MNRKRKILSLVLLMMFALSVMAQTPISITSSVILTWNASTGETPITYNVGRSTTSGGSYTTIVSGLSALTYTDSTVAPQTTYYYVISATNVNGTSANSSEVSAHVP